MYNYLSFRCLLSLGLFLFTRLLLAQTTPTATPSPATTISLADTELAYLLNDSFVDVAKRSRIIAIGESTHGMGNLFAERTKIIKALHEGFGYNLILFESGFGDALLANQRMADLSTEAYGGAVTSYTYYHSQGMLDLFHYVQTANATGDSIRLFGYDCQPQQDYLIRRLQEAFDQLDSASVDVRQIFSNFNKLYLFDRDQQVDSFYYARDAFCAQIQQLQQQLLAAPQLLPDEKEAFRLGLDNLLLTYSTIQPGRLMQFPRSTNYRDSMMFENIRYLLERYPNEKAIVLGQNYHISRGDVSANPDVPVWTGYYLSEIYGDHYYSIGTAVKEGTDYQQMRQEVYTFQSEGPEYLVNRVNWRPESGTTFIHVASDPLLSKLDTELIIKGIGNRDNPFVIKECFDGLLLFPEGKAVDILQLRE